MPYFIINKMPFPRSQKTQLFVIKITTLEKNIEQLQTQIATLQTQTASLQAQINALKS